jgi:hypothetical protein
LGDAAKGRDALSFPHLRGARDLRITGIRPAWGTGLEPSHDYDWLPALLQSTSAACRETVESLHLAFVLHVPEDMGRVAWGEVERALSPARFPRLRRVRVRFTVYLPGLSLADVARRLPGLASRAVVEIVEEAPDC